MSETYQSKRERLQQLLESPPENLNLENTKCSRSCAGVMLRFATWSRYTWKRPG